MPDPNPKPNVTPTPTRTSMVTVEVPRLVGAERTKVITPQNVTSVAGLTIRKSVDITNNGFVAGFYGRGGGGKTTTAAMICKSIYAGRVLHVNLHGGPSAIAHLPIDVVTPLKWAEIVEVRKAVGEGEIDLSTEHGKGTVILDTWSEGQNSNLRKIAPSGNIEIQHWGKSQADIMGETREWIDIAERDGINVIFVLWLEEDEDKDVGITRRHVSFARKLAAQWPGLVTFIGLIEPVEGKPEWRHADFRPSNKTDAKLRVAPTELAKAIPYEMWYQRDTPLVADMLDVIHGAKTWPAEKYQRPSNSSARNARNNSSDSDESD